MRAEAPLTPTGPARVCTGGPRTQAGPQQGAGFLPDCRWITAGRGPRFPHLETCGVAWGVSRTRL